MKTKFILLMVIGMGGLSHLHAAQSSKDSVDNVLSAKVKQLELLVQTLHTEIRSLKSADSTHFSEIQKLKQSLQMATPKKVVINRRGSKQASIQ